MLFQWNENTLRWFQDASDYTGYNRELAKLLRPFLKDCSTLCDVGCGMALIDFELAPNLEQITCVDISEDVIQYVNERAERLQVQNLRTFCKDSKMQPLAADKSDLAAEDGAYDAVMALFHGTVETCGERYLSYARKKLILAVHASEYGSTGPKKYRVRKCCDVKSTEDWLNANGLSYEKREGALEFGQPHRTFEDAVEYTRAFTKNVPEEELRTYVKEHVIETGRDDFPLYTPKTRQMGIFVIDAVSGRRICLQKE